LFRIAVAVDARKAGLGYPSSLQVPLAERDLEACATPIPAIARRRISLRVRLSGSARQAEPTTASEELVMWRALALAIGISFCILGAECLVVEKAVLASSRPVTAETGVLGQTAPVERPREIEPPEWAPWSLISLGAVVILYSFSIPKRVAS
jgi:hypothetical protein